MIGAETAVEIGSAALGVAMLLAVAATLLWNRRRYALLLLSQAILLPVLATVMLHAASIDFHPRYYVAGVPAALMLIVSAAHSLPVHAEVRLPDVIGSSMVLQQKMTVPIWGTAEPGEAVTVSFAGQKKTDIAGQDGKWRVDLGKLAARFTPQTMTIAAPPPSTR